MNNLLATLVLGTAAFEALGQPIIITQPESQTNVLGTIATFSVEATGVLPLWSQWRRHTGFTVFTDLVGETNAALYLTNVQTSAANFRYAVVTSDITGSATSVLARLTVLLPPAVTMHPSNQTVEVGEAVRFSLLATGTPPLFYQWRFNDADLVGKTNNTLSLANVSFMNSGNYTAVVTNMAGSVTSEVAALTVVSPVFTKITTGSIVNDGGSSVSCAWGDYDHDSFLDMFVANEGGLNFLYHNNGNGTFTRVLSSPVGTDGGFSESGIWADFNNDGNLDLFVASQNAPHHLYRNDGHEIFTRVTNSLASDLGPSSGAVWADFDGDGFVDLFRAQLEDTDSQLYRNDRQGGFSKVTSHSGLRVHAWSGGCAAVDYNDDGALDLFVGSSDSPSFLYRNNGDGTFTRVSPVESQIVASDWPWAAAWGDYDNDGDLDLFVARLFFENNLLFRNDGNGTFTKITSGAIVRDGGNSWGGAWGDFDNDGWLDLFVSNGGDRISQTNFLYRNNGDGTFSKITTGKVVNDSANSESCGWGDYDNDGFLDLFVCNYFGQNNALYHNVGNSNAWIVLKLVGTISNRSAIGAKVRVKARFSGTTHWQRRDISGGDGWSNGSSLNAHFGLGEATNIDLVRIEWPSGTLQELTNVAVRQFLNITETIPAQITLWRPPQSQNVSVGGDVKLFVQVSGSPPLQYQWRRDGVELPGATNRLLFMSNLQTAQSGTYTVLVTSSNGLDTVESEAGTLTISAPADTTHRFGAITAAPGHPTQLQLTSQPRPGHYDIFPLEASTNLSDWIGLLSPVSSNGVARFTDTQATNFDARFYRASSNQFITPFPTPTGSHAVGTFSRLLVDASRSNKKIMTSVYYPAAPAPGARPTPLLDPRLGALECARFFGFSNSFFAGLYASAVSNAAIATDQTNYPVLIYSHGYTDMRSLNVARPIELASHGYVVVTLDHRDALATVLPDGTLVQGTFDLNLQNPAPTLQGRVLDAQLVLNQLTSWNESDPLLAGRLDLFRVGGIGFSLGGSTVAELCRVDSRCRIGVAMDGVLLNPTLLNSGLSKPFLFLRADTPDPDPAALLAQGIVDDRMSFFNRLTQDAYWVKIRGTIHGNFGDNPSAVFPHVPRGLIDNRRAAEVAHVYVVSFCDKYLKERDNHLLDGLSPDYPEVIQFLRK